MSATRVVTNDQPPTHRGLQLHPPNVGLQLVCLGRLGLPACLGETRHIRNRSAQGFFTRRQQLHESLLHHGKRRATAFGLLHGASLVLRLQDGKPQLHGERRHGKHGVRRLELSNASTLDERVPFQSEQGRHDRASALHSWSQPASFVPLPTSCPAWPAAGPSPFSRHDTHVQHPVMSTCARTRGRACTTAYLRSVQHRAELRGRRGAAGSLHVVLAVAKAGLDVLKALCEHTALVTRPELRQLWNTKTSTQQR